MSVMEKGALPSLKNPVLEALYRRIRNLEESLTRAGETRPTRPAATLRAHAGPGPGLRPEPGPGPATPRAQASGTRGGEDARPGGGAFGAFAAFARFASRAAASPSLTSARGPPPRPPAPPAPARVSG